ncbi:MAG: DMT family transporter [Holophagaceae bacterium]|nr:DMT family transporter [Holophagaceae bacterium]
MDGTVHPPRAKKHVLAVFGLLGTALVWGGTFAAVAYALRAGLSVHALLSLRFALGALALGAVLLALRMKPTRRELLDGLWLGLVCATLFWLQTDGLRFTTTAKSAFITGLYVIFTPMISVLVGDRLRASHGIGAALALTGLLLLVYQPGISFGGWNRGDSETLLNAMLVGVHIVLTGHFSRRGRGWVLAWSQVAVVGAVFSIAAACSPNPYGFQGAAAALHIPGLWIALAYLALLATTLAFYVQSAMQAHVSATETAVLFSIEPVFAALVAVSGWIPGIKEHLSPRQWAGAVLIVSATLLAELGPKLWKARAAGEEEAIG